MRITIGNMRKRRVPVSLGTYITIGDMCHAIFVVSETFNLSESQSTCLRHAWEKGRVSHPFGPHLIQTIRSLVLRGLLIPEISDEEYAVQNALGIGDKERSWVLNEEILHPYIYETRTNAWLKYTTIQNLEKGQ